MKVMMRRLNAVKYACSAEAVKALQEKGFEVVEDMAGLEKEGVTQEPQPKRNRKKKDGEDGKPG